ncbi:MULTISPECIES: response regulator transcription factor [unclassified Oceanispirochaeta]|uniref:response regulator transcription factor n=1 Tax=unclassified Oceanispirochaeta TaxID=2635722 RepID=UPI000E08E200|nr:MULTISPECIES: response regulator transcription factor [unclassified Oceanispirochaeta]MBF9018273.1 response regulator transcription factor [Oceanispirochaeta sp. M2]NPD74738.1 response regulator transcription factor [Oceanispirochaeta sp. M1]RDG29408.1 DNA-binding response regulator [Oceanispirochaeta sp. M1]
MKQKKLNILLLEDNPAQYALLSAYLEKELYGVLHAGCIGEFNRLIEIESPDLILLDLNLPDGDGLQLVNMIRFDLEIPLIIITSRDTMMDRLAGLELGADDYICKPYHPRELLIRIKNLLIIKNKTTSTTTAEMRINDFYFNKEFQSFYDKNRNEIKLTSGEYHIITNLIEAKGRLLSRSQLLENAFNRIEYPTDRTIDVLISRLRKKFASKLGDPEIIETVKGFGYRINKDLIVM